MAITLVQHNPFTSGAAPANGSYGVAPTNGNNLILVACYDGNSASAIHISSITQTGATWVKAIANNFDDGTRTASSEIWYAENVSGAGTGVTVNFNGTGFQGGWFDAIEVSGLAASSSLDLTATNHGSGGTTIDSGTTGTTTTANEFWVASLMEVETVAATYSAPTNGFTLLDQGFVSFGQGGLCYKIVSATGTANVTVTSTAIPFEWAGAIATFKAPGGGPTPAKQLLTMLGCGA